MTPEPSRHITLEGSSNLRDIGGYRSADGQSVRWGQIYRSGALGQLRPRDWDWMNAQQIGALCDLRSHEERVMVPTTWQGDGPVRHIGEAYPGELVFGSLQHTKDSARIGEMGQSLYTLFPRLLVPSFRAMFDALLERQTPIIVHCSAGQDRTGLAVALILSALGVPRDVIYEDFLLSTDARRVANEIDHKGIAQHAETNIVARFYAELLAQHGESAFTPRRLVNRSGTPLLTEAFTHIEAEWGSLPAYLEQELGLDAARGQRLRDLYLENA